MKKIITTACILITAISVSHAQANKCATTEVMRNEMDKNPQVAAEIEQQERGYQEWQAGPHIGYREGEKYIIPVVFHVIHEGGSENISKAQIEDQMKILNRDFNHRNADSLDTPHPFRASEEAWFSFSSPQPADYVPYTMVLDTLDKVLTSDTKVNGSTIACDDSVAYYADTVVTIPVQDYLFTLSIASAGSGYGNGNHTNVRALGGSGTSAFLNVTVTSGIVSAVTVAYGGSNYADGDVLTVNDADLGGSGSGLTVSVDSVITKPVTFKYPQSSASTYENFEPVCSKTVVSSLAGTDAAYFYARSGNLVVDSVLADTASAIEKTYLHPDCYYVVLDADTTYVPRDSYITVQTPSGVKRSFYFKDGLSNITPSTAPGSLTIVDISNIYCSADSIAKAFVTAANALPDYFGYYGVVEGVPTAKVACETPGETTDYYSRNIDAVSDSTWCQGHILWGRLNVEFRLAQLDPQGNCTEGITRTYSNKTNAASNANGLKDLMDWNCYSYFNVWVVKSIENFSSFGTILGYAQFPASGLCGTDGVVMLHSQVGSIGSAASAEGRTLVHEAGHWLGLRHIWGDADCGSDEVSDTPAAFGPNFGVCYDDYIHFGTDTCDNTNPYGEMMVNYMDYSNDECMKMFTVGQCEKMLYTLAGINGNNGVRSSLWSESNLLLTGVSDASPENPCAPIADFQANKPFACTGTTIVFTDKSYNGTVSSRLWSFPGGSPESATTATVSVTYSATGTYPVTLASTNAAGTGTTVKTDYIHIAGTSAEQVADYTYFEDFEESSNFNSRWTVINPDNSPIHKWENVGNLSTPSGGGALRVTNYFNTTSEYEEAISPSFDLTSLQGPVVLSYQYSGATRTQLGVHTIPDGLTVNGDVLKVFYSTNCGESWSVIAQLGLSASTLINAGLYSDFYVPDANSIWTEKQTTLTNAMLKPNVKFKFRYEVGGSIFMGDARQGYGNNFYLDGLRIENITGVEELNTLLGVQVYPNPSAGITRIALNTPENGKLSLGLYDMLGREVASVYSGSVTSGDHTYTIDVNNFDAGLYFLKIIYNDKTSTVKLVVE